MIKRLAFLAALLCASPAWGAVTFQSSGTFSNKTSAPMTMTAMATHDSDDILIAVAISFAASTATPDEAGWTAFTGFNPATIPASSSNPTAKTWAWWKRATSTSTPLSVTFDTENADCTAASTPHACCTGSGTGTCQQDQYYHTIAFRGAVTTGDPFEVVGSVGQFTNVEDFSQAGITTLTAGSMVISIFPINDNTPTTIDSATGTDPASYTTVFGDSGVSVDAGNWFAYAVRSCEGATGSITYAITGTAVFSGASIVVALVDAAPPAQCGGGRRRLF